MSSQVKATFLAVASCMLAGRVVTIEGLRAILGRPVEEDLLWLVQAGLLHKRSDKLILTLLGCITAADLIAYETTPRDAV